MKKILLTLLLFLISSSAHATVWYACSGGGNWNGASVWTSVQVDQVGCIAATGNPVAGDTATLNSTSGNITITATAAAAIIDMTGYTGTLAVGTNILNITGGVTLGGTITGTGTLTLLGTQTLTSNAITWPGAINFTVGTFTYTFSGNWINAGSMTIGGNSTLNKTTSETLTIQNGLAMNGLPATGTLPIIMTGGTWTSIVNETLKNNLTLQGNITISGAVYYSTTTLAYSSGTITTTGSTLNLGAGPTLDTGGMNWNSIVFNNSATVTLLSSLNSTSMSVIAGIINFSGLFPLNMDNMTLLAGAITLQASNTININKLFISGSNGANLITIKSGTASSPVYLNYKGSAANNLTNGIVYTDVIATSTPIKGFNQPLLNMNGGALTRTKGITNVTAANIALKNINTYSGV